jgi:CheY-like chemotaxis protein
VVSQSDRVFGKSILVADDQPLVRATIRLLLNADGHAVVEAQNGREALELYEPHRFDLVITDYDMPEMPGDELACQIKQRDPAQPILMVSSLADTLAGSSLAVDGILAKPFRSGELRHAVAELTCSLPA